MCDRAPLNQRPSPGFIRGLAFVIIAGFATAWVSFAPCAIAQSIPHLERRGAVTQLIVGGEPFIMLGGELHNSSASSLEYMEPIWPRLASMNLNTVLVTVSWELIEPQESQFDFHLVDGLLSQASHHNLKVVLLWFGSWKNGVSSYVPGWVKKDVIRFPRVEGQAGERIEVLTPLGEAACKADARAFGALMQHLKQVDGKRHTVIMVQVENEVGLLGDPRDRSKAADAQFAKPVPPALLEYFVSHKTALIPEFKACWEAAGAKTAGTWAEVFGEGADEAFMAWHYARYINAIAGAGKKEYSLPMYANAWLVQDDKQRAGQYPSGGPVSKVLDVWRAAGTSIDLLAPDIYLPDFKGVCESYSRSGNALFIPEAGTDAACGARAFYAIGQHAAMGFSPFGIDSIGQNASPSFSTFGIDSIGYIPPVRESYAVLAGLMPTITKFQPEGKVIGLLQDKTDRETKQLAGYNLEVNYSSKDKNGQPGYGLVIATAADEFMVAGAGIGIHFSGATAGPKHTGILAIDEWVSEPIKSMLSSKTSRVGHLVKGRRMNGDENAGGWRLELPPGKPTIQQINLYRYE